MARVETFNFNQEVFEVELLGMICFMYDTFDLRPIIDLEISLIEEPKYFPKKWGKSFTLIKNVRPIKALYNKLKIPHESRPSRLEGHPIFKPGSNSAGKVFQYFLREGDTKNFGYGYNNMNQIVRKYMDQCEANAIEKQSKNKVKSNSEKKDVLEENSSPKYKDDWKMESNIVNESKLIFKPDQQVIGKNFLLKVPAYVWDLPSVDGYGEQVVVNLISLYLRDCTSEEHILLIEKPTFLRFLLYQDTPDGKPYVYGYIKKIDECTYPSHKHNLNLIRNHGKFLPSEMVYPKESFFWAIRIEEWKERVIEHIDVFG